MADDLAPDPQSARLVDDVRALLRAARTRAFAGANAATVDAYRQIGRRILEEEQGGELRAEYSSQLIRNLARALGELRWGSCLAPTYELSSRCVTRETKLCLTGLPMSCGLAS